MVAEGTPDELKRRIAGGHAQLYFRDLAELDSAAKAIGEAARDDGTLTLRVPTDSGSRSLLALLERLDQHALAAERVTLHTPDLDDVFLALTAAPRDRQDAPR